MSEGDYFDNVFEGMVLELGTKTFEAEEIIAFARDFDPQPFHLSQEGAANSNFGKLCASGWHTLSVWMGMNIRNARPAMRKLTGYTGPDPELGPSPGVRNIRWTWPVYVGDTISFRSTLLEKRDHPRREGWGLLMSRSEGFNQDGKRVFSVEGTVLMKREK